MTEKADQWVKEQLDRTTRARIAFERGEIDEDTFYARSRWRIPAALTGAWAATWVPQGIERTQGHVSLLYEVDADEEGPFVSAIRLDIADGAKRLVSEDISEATSRSRLTRIAGEAAAALLSPNSEHESSASVDSDQFVEPLAAQSKRSAIRDVRSRAAQTQAEAKAQTFDAEFDRWKPMWESTKGMNDLDRHNAIEAMSGGFSFKQSQTFAAELHRREAAAGGASADG